MEQARHRRRAPPVQELGLAMPLTLQGYYAILDVKGSSVDLPAALDHAVELLAAGPCCLQLRGKHLGPALFCQLGHALRSLCGRTRVPLCINDRLDVALAVKADAVHLGQNDLPLSEALRACKVSGAGQLAIGVSTHDLVQARAAATGGADYIGFGPVFATQSKAAAAPMTGLQALREVASVVRIPVVAIGGITLETASAVVAAGASAAAVIAAVDEAPDRTLAGRRIAAAFRA
jgi:thiamine-phosphate pyrophosphorylase